MVWLSSPLENGLRIKGWESFPAKGPLLATVLKLAVPNWFESSKPAGVFKKSPLPYRLNKSILVWYTAVPRPKGENEESNVSVSPLMLGKLRVICVSIKGVE